MNQLWPRVLAFLFVFFVGCRDYKEYELQSNENVPEVVHFTSLFENSSIKIGMHHGIGEGLFLGIKGLSKKRYLFESYFKVDVDSRNTPRKVGDMKVAVYELFPNEEAVEVGFRRKLLGIVNESDFMELDSDDEVFEYIGVEPKEDLPVENSEKILDMW